MARARRAVASGVALLAAAALAMLAAAADDGDTPAAGDGGVLLEAEDVGGAALLPLDVAEGSALDAAEGGALDALLPRALHAPLEDLLRAASLACDALPLEEMFRGARVPELRGVLVSAQGRRVLRLSRAADVLAARGGGGVRGALTVYVPGWWNTPEDAAARALVAALLRRESSVLVVDTRPAFCRPYLAAAARVPAVARQVAQLAGALRARGLPPPSLHLLGFSLGAHAAGLAGRLVRARLTAPVGRLTALDPARPCFGVPAAARGVRREDAAFVQVVHSSAGTLGVAQAVGHADVYVGRPGARLAACRSLRRVPLECEHNEAWRVFARSARRALRGRACRGWSELAAGACSGPPALLGYSCSNHSHGIFLYNSPELV